MLLSTVGCPTKINMVMPDTVTLIPIKPLHNDLWKQAEMLANKWGFPLDKKADSGLCLLLDYDQLALQDLNTPKEHPVSVNFASEALEYRRTHGGGNSEAIAKAVGLKGRKGLHVVDATAGLGRDSFILASLGCNVTMIERSNVVAALLENGLERAQLTESLMDWLPKQLSLLHGSAIELLRHWEHSTTDVIYLDPMFPHRKKSALVKKDMRLFQQLLGPDEDADALLEPAIGLAQERVVVKRPNSAPYLAEQKPSIEYKSKKHRFDVYLTA